MQLKLNQYYSYKAIAQLLEMPAETFRQQYIVPGKTKYWSPQPGGYWIKGAWFAECIDNECTRMNGGSQAPAVGDLPAEMVYYPEEAETALRPVGRGSRSGPPSLAARALPIAKSRADLPPPGGTDTDGNPVDDGYRILVTNNQLLYVVVNGRYFADPKFFHKRLTKLAALSEIEPFQTATVNLDDVGKVTFYRNQANNAWVGMPELTRPPTSHGEVNGDGNFEGLGIGVGKTAPFVWLPIDHSGALESIGRARRSRPSSRAARSLPIAESRADLPTPGGTDADGHPVDDGYRILVTTNQLLYVVVNDRYIADPKFYHKRLTKGAHLAALSEIEPFQTATVQLDNVGKVTFYRNQANNAWMGMPELTRPPTSHGEVSDDGNFEGLGIGVGGTAPFVWLPVARGDGPPLSEDIELGTPTYDANDKTVTVPILRAPRTGKFDLEIFDEDDSLVYEQEGTWKQKPKNSWNHHGFAFPVTDSLQAGNDLVFNVAAHLAYKIRVMTADGLSHEQKVEVAPPLPAKKSGMNRMSSFDGRLLTEADRAKVQAEFNEWKSGRLDQFAANKEDRVAGLNNGVRNALALPGERANRHDEHNYTKPSVHIPVNGGPGYFRTGVRTERRCQFFLSIAGGTGTKDHTLKGNTVYRFGGDFRIQADQDWWNVYRSISGAVLTVWGFHVDYSDEPEKPSLPGESLGLYLISRGADKDPSLQVRITGDERVDTDLSKLPDDKRWRSGMKGEDGRWCLYYPLSKHHHWNTSANPRRRSETPRNHLEFQPGRWYRYLTEFVLDCLGLDEDHAPDRQTSAGSTRVWINEVHRFAEDEDSLVVDEDKITNCFMIGPGYSPKALCAREPQLGTDHHQFRHEIYKAANPTGRVRIDHTNFFIDEEK